MLFLKQYNKDIFTILIMTLLLTTLLIMKIPKKLNMGDITYIDINYNINKGNITYMFLSGVISKVLYR